MSSMEVTVNRNHKSRIFEMVFSDRKELLTLYNAVNGTNYTEPEQLEINTLENAIYMSMHNDVSFIVDSRLSLYEHQSTYNPNLPLRYLFYVTDLYSTMTRDFNLYGTKLLKLPTPNFIVFYNGVEECPERQELRLSASYSVQDREPSLELKATLLNINPGNNKALMDACRTLKDYAEYTSRVRRYAEIMDLKEAVERAIDECIREGILAEFLSHNRAEAKKMSIYEYDEEKHMRQTKEEGREEGREEGIQILIQTCRELDIPREVISKKLMEKFSFSGQEAEEKMIKYWK